MCRQIQGYREGKNLILPWGRRRDSQKAIDFRIDIGVIVAVESDSPEVEEDISGRGSSHTKTQEGSIGNGDCGWEYSSHDLVQSGRGKL